MEVIMLTKLTINRVHSQPHRRIKSGLLALLLLFLTLLGAEARSAQAAPPTPAQSGKVAVTISLNGANLRVPPDFQGNLAAYQDGQPSAQEMPVKVDASGTPTASLTLTIAEAPTTLNVELRHPQDGTVLALVLALDPARATVQVMTAPPALPSWLKVPEPTSPVCTLTVAVNRAAVLAQIEVAEPPQLTSGWQVAVATAQDGLYEPGFTAPAVARGPVVGLEDESRPLYVVSSGEQVSVQVQFRDPAGQPVATNQGEINFTTGEFLGGITAPTRPEVRRMRLALGAVEKAVTLPVVLPATVTGTTSTKDPASGITVEYTRGFPTAAPNVASDLPVTPEPTTRPTTLATPPPSPRGESAALTLSVVQQRDLSPVAGARVELEGAAGSLLAQSDTKGRVAWADLAPGQYQFTVTKAGYQPVTQVAPLASGQRPHRTVELTTTAERTNRWLLPALAGLVGVLALALVGLLAFSGHKQRR
jgi:hypothetical protein